MNFYFLLQSATRLTQHMCTEWAASIPVARFNWTTKKNEQTKEKQRRTKKKTIFNVLRLLVLHYSIFIGLHFYSEMKAAKRNLFPSFWFLIIGHQFCTRLMWLNLSKEALLSESWKTQFVCSRDCVIKGRHKMWNLFSFFLFSVDFCWR